MTAIVTHDRLQTSIDLAKEELAELQSVKKDLEEKYKYSTWRMGPIYQKQIDANDQKISEVKADLFKLETHQ